MKSLRFNFLLITLLLEADEIYPYTWGKVLVWDIPGAQVKINFGVRLTIKAPLVNKIIEFTLCVR